MNFIVAQIGARMHYAVPRILHDAGMLERLYTDSYLGNKPWLQRALGLMPAPLRSGGASRLLGRKEERIPPVKVTSFDAFGLEYARAQRRAKGTAELARIYADFARGFCERIIARRPDADAVWAFNGAAAELFRWAKARGQRCLLEQTSAPKRLARRLVAEELQRWPGWQPGLRLPPEPNPLAEREEEEWVLADRIVAGSPFVADGIRQCDGPAHKCVLVPMASIGSFSRRLPQPPDLPPRAGFASCSLALSGCGRVSPTCWKRCGSLAPRRSRGASQDGSRSPPKSLHLTGKSPPSLAPSLDSRCPRSTGGPTCSSCPPSRREDRW
jgi:hypothetical protein